MGIGSFLTVLCFEYFDDELQQIGESLNIRTFFRNGVCALVAEQKVIGTSNRDMASQRI